MAALNNLYVSSSFQGLMKLTNSATGLTNSLQTIQAGDGSNSPLQMSLTQVNISGSLTVNGSSVTAGTSGTSGSNGTDGSSGTSGSNGTDGSSGTSGSNGTNGSSGTSGSNGTNGTSGSNGTDGTSGTSGSNGTNGSSGSNGSSGTSGSNGTSGTNGSSGSNGTDGSSGTSGSNGTDGTSGSNGTDGTSGSNGTDGSSGTSGVSPSLVGVITTGSLASTQSISGSLIVNDLIVSGNLVGNSINQGLIKIKTETYESGSVQFENYITSSAPISQSNLIFGSPFGAAGPTQTGSVIISGSNNIIFNGTRGGTIQIGTLGYIQGNSNIIGTIPVISTSSFLNGNIFGHSSNIHNAPLTIDAPATGAITSTDYFNQISSNNLGGGVLLRHKSGSFSMNNNNSQGTINSFATQSLLYPSGAISGPTIQGNVHAGSTTTLSHISSSIIYNNNISDSSNLIIRNSATHPAALNGSGSVTVSNNIFGGGTTTLTISGSGVQATKSIVGNMSIGANNELNVINSGSNGVLGNTAMLGQGLIVSGNLANTNSGGSAFVGRWNATGSNQETISETVFVVGTGTAANSRRNALRIDNNNNSNFTGSVNISGSLLLNGVTVGDGNRNGLITTGSAGAIQNITGSLIISNNLIITGSISTSNSNNTVKSELVNANTYEIRTTATSLINTQSGSVIQMSYNSGSNNAQFAMQASVSGQTADFSIINNAGVTSVRSLSDSVLFAKNQGFPNTPSTTFEVDATNIILSGNTAITGSLVVTGSLSVGGNLQFNVGDFYSTQTQSGSANVSGSVTYNNTGISNGVTLASNSRLTIANSGVYSITFSAQLKEVGGTDTIYLWLKKNGTNVADTGTKTVVRNNDENIMTVEYIVQAAANDYYEIVFQNVNGHAQLYYEAASGNIPATPSIITTVKQVR